MQLFPCLWSRSVAPPIRSLQVPRAIHTLAMQAARDRAHCCMRSRTQPLPLPLLLLLLTVLCPALVNEPGRMQGAQGAPLTADWTTCAPTVTRQDVDCCTLPELMTPGGPRAYKELDEYLRENPLPERPRVRPAAHLVARNATYLAQLNRAYQLMRELPRTDPRSMPQQMNMHCMYGSLELNIVMQRLQHATMDGAPAPGYTVHRNWLWLPFHRWLTFFTERILARLVGDEQFALPFWNWDNQSPELADGQDFLPNVIPHFYRDPENYPALFDVKRHPRYTPGYPDVIVDLNYDYDFQGDLDKLRRHNNERLHHYIAATTQGLEGRYSFLSHPLRSGDDPMDYIGNGVDVKDVELTFDYQVHGVIHTLLGDPASDLEDMGHVWTALNDAIFMAHHSNIDRIWSVWQSLGGKEFDEPDFLDASFFFYDENAELVRVTVADCLDHRKLKIDWQLVDNPWVLPEFATSSPDCSLLRSTS